MNHISDYDKPQLQEKGISREKLLDQIDTFTAGIPFVKLVKAAVVDDGISKFSDQEEMDLIQRFEDLRKGLSLLKFVPASGAASRMFKALFNFLDVYDPKDETLKAYVLRTSDNEIDILTQKMSALPFYSAVMARIAGESTSKDEEIYNFVNELLSEKHLNYGFFPKGLLPFHNYRTYVATPFEEHLKEAALYSKTNDTAQLHFTISEQHGDMFNEEFSSVKERVASKTKTSFQVGYSFQKPSTDTIAVDLENQPFRNRDGSLLFRPGGHGALIENLNEQDADIIFIKNIDNVVIEKNLEAVANSKKVLAGRLLKVQNKVFEFARLLEASSVSEGKLSEIKGFLERELNARFLDKYYSYNQEEQIAILKDKIDRPIRVCGMVRNEGEPGGGPFWISDTHGNISLQIIESAQVDMQDPEQVQILRNATHFNPVDLVCGIKDHKGNKFNLLDFIDYKQGFISSKTKDGKPLKALELPGLWNGAMAYWNTIFVEVPLFTFNPVKTVNDLLKPSHQVG